PLLSRGGAGGLQKKCGMKMPGMNPRLRELVALAVLAAFGCGLALSQGDLLFVAIFGGACAMIIIGAVRRFSWRTERAVAIRALPDLCLGIVSGRLRHLDP